MKRRVSDLEFSSAMRQLHLFPPPAPLLSRLGEQFFRAAPRAPGVYIMTGESERVLYIGQSKNLRSRLGVYNNAKRDRVPRKIIRLVHEVRSIVWEKCESVEAAKVREIELLHLHRPKFNVANTWPAPQRFFTVKHNDSGLELDCAPDTEPRSATALEFRDEPQLRTFGPFKSSAVLVYGALLRLLWAAFHCSSAPAYYPAGFFGAKPPRPFRFRSSGEVNGQGQHLEMVRVHSELCAFLDNRPNELIPFLKSSLPPDPHACKNLMPEGPDPAARGFQFASYAHDFEILQLFGGPRS